MTTKDYHERVARLFDQRVSEGWAERMEMEHTSVARAAFERTRLRREQSYLDIGCGNGYSVRWACQVHSSVEAYGIDISSGMIQHARSRSDAFPNARFIHSAFPLPELKEQSFDAIVAIESFYFMPDALWALANVHRLLKPGGRFVCVMDRYAENTAYKPWDDGTDVDTHRFSIETWRELIADAGLLTFEQSHFKSPQNVGDTPSWKHDPGRLLMVARRPVLED